MEEAASNRIPQTPASDVPSPSFYKMLLPHNKTIGPTIPSELVKIMGKDLHGTATLASDICTWEVSLVKQEGGGIAFRDGWKNFYAGNSLENGDLLIFYYFGNLSFGVDKFSTNGFRKPKSKNCCP